jgi:hypothetical protein
MTQDDWFGIFVLSKSNYIDLSLDGSVVRWTHYDWVNSGILQNFVGIHPSQQVGDCEGTYTLCTRPVQDMKIRTFRLRQGRLGLISGRE